MHARWPHPSTPDLTAPCVVKQPVVPGSIKVQAVRPMHISRDKKCTCLHAELACDSAMPIFLTVVCKIRKKNYIIARALEHSAFWRSGPVSLCYQHTTVLSNICRVCCQEQTQLATPTHCGVSSNTYKLSVLRGSAQFSLLQPFHYITQLMSACTLAPKGQVLKPVPAFKHMVVMMVNNMNVVVLIYFAVAARSPRPGSGII